MDRGVCFVSCLFIVLTKVVWKTAKISLFSFSFFFSFNKGEHVSWYVCHIGAVSEADGSGFTLMGELKLSEN